MPRLGRGTRPRPHLSRSEPKHHADLETPRLGGGRRLAEERRQEIAAESSVVDTVQDVVSLRVQLDAIPARAGLRRTAYHYHVAAHAAAVAARPWPTVPTPLPTPEANRLRTCSWRIAPWRPKAERLCQSDVQIPGGHAPCAIAPQPRRTIVCHAVAVAVETGDDRVGQR